MLMFEEVFINDIPFGSGKLSYTKDGLIIELIPANSDVQKALKSIFPLVEQQKQVKLNVNQQTFFVKLSKVICTSQSAYIGPAFVNYWAIEHAKITVEFLEKTEHICYLE